MSGMTLNFPEEMLDLLAERVAAKLSERQQPAEAEDGWLRGAKEIAGYIGCGESRVKALHSAGRIPLHKDGRWLLGKKSELDAWIEGGGGVRP